MPSSLIRVLGDLRDAARTVERRPATFFIAVATMALVTAAAGAVTAVGAAAFVRPLPFPEPSRLLRLNTMPPGVTALTDANPFGPLTFLRFRDELGPFEAVEGIWVRERGIGTDGEPETAAVGDVSAGFLTLLGTPPVLGRAFTAADDRAAAKVVVLSHAFWRRKFAEDRRVLGQLLTIDREPHEIVGVMPPEFEPAFTQTELWTPIGIREDRLIMPAATFIQTVARRRADVDIESARTKAAEMFAQVRRESPAILTGWELMIRPLREAQFGRQRPAILMLIGAALFLGLIAAVNLTHLALADFTSRRGDMALRLALGANRTDLLRAHIVERILVGAVGTVIGLAIAWMLLPLLTALDPTALATSLPVRIDAGVALVTFVSITVLTLAISLVPVWRLTRQDLASTLTQGDRRTIGSRGQIRLRTGLVAFEMALAVVLLAAGMMLLDALRRTASVDPGFDPSGVVGAQIRLPENAYPTPDHRAAFVSQVLERIRAISGVEGASTTLNRYVPGFAFVTLVHIDGRPTPGGEAHTVQFRRVSPDYFKTMRIREVRGRTFDTRDVRTSQPVAVVSESFARRFWPGEDPIGRTLRRGASSHLTVIGVVSDVSDVRLDQAPEPTIYIAYAQNNVSGTPASLVVRSSRPPQDLIPTIKAAVWEVDPLQPLANFTTLDRFLDDSLGPQRFRSTLLLIVAGIGLVLASLGIYGVTGRTVLERQREAGVRLALGAAPSQVWWTIASRAIAGVAAGAAIGILGLMLLQRTLIAILPELANGSLLTSTLPALLVLLAVGGLAAAVPARRAARVDPVLTLRMN